MLPRKSRSRARLWSLVALWTVVCNGGCAAITNPVAYDAIPVRRLPDEVIAATRDEAKTIPMTMLAQRPNQVYRIGPGDVLGIYIETLLGSKGEAPPIRATEGTNGTPSIGYPIAVQDDGNIELPYVPPIGVQGMTLAEAREAIRVAVMEKKQIVKPEFSRIFVSLMQPRKYRVVVVRQDAGNVNVDNVNGGLLAGKRGSGVTVDLPAYENDLLHALSRTGGLPGLEAFNEIIIQRNRPKVDADGNIVTASSTVRIPLRLRPNDPIPFMPEDVILHDGDVVFIEARDNELFYTAGLLPPGQQILPRDFDLDVIKAIALVRGPLVSGAFNQQNQFSNSVLSAGIGFPSPSLLTVLRKMPNGKQISIRVDLNLALRDPRERISVRAGDILILQEKSEEAIARYFSAVFRLNLLGTIIKEADLLGTTSLAVP